MRITFLLMLLVSGCSVFQEKSHPRWNYEDLVGHGFSVFFLNENSIFEFDLGELKTGILDSFKSERAGYSFDLAGQGHNQKDLCYVEYAHNDLGVALGEYPLYIVVNIRSSKKYQSKESVYTAPDENGKREKAGRNYISIYELGSDVVVCDAVTRDVLFEGRVKTELTKTNKYTEYCENKKYGCKLFSHISQGRDFPVHPEASELVRAHSADVASLLPQIPCKDIGFWACFKRGFD